jgi:hypothetical protein
VYPSAGLRYRREQQSNICPQIHGRIFDVRPPQLAASFISSQACDVCCWQILLQKYFWAGELKFSEPLMRLVPHDVRDHIVLLQNDHGPSYRRHGASQRQRCVEIDFREIFGVIGFSTFATLSARTQLTGPGWRCLLIGGSRKLGFGAVRTGFDPAPTSSLIRIRANSHSPIDRKVVVFEELHKAFF